MDKNIPDIYNLLQEIAWRFGSQGFNGECCEDLSLVEFMALKRADENNNISIQEIGNAINFTKSGATRIIDRLENKGYIKREHSPVDGRVCCVNVTAKGRDVIARIMIKYTSYLEKALKDLEPRTIDNIKDVLGILVKSINSQD